MVKQFSIHYVNLDPAEGMEMKKTRPAVVLSPNNMNDVLGTVIIAPMTTTLRGYPSRMELRFQNKFCEICLDQMRAVDSGRLSKDNIGRLNNDQIEDLKDTLAQLFTL